MTINVNPPPLQIPPNYLKTKEDEGFFNSLIRTIYQLWREVYSLRFQATTKTTDASLTAMQRVTVNLNKTIYFEARVVARRTGGTAGSDGDSAFYRLDAAFKNIGGSLTQIGSIITNGGEDQAAWNATFGISGSEILLLAQGAANNNITWESTLSIYEVGV